MLKLLLQTRGGAEHHFHLEAGVFTLGSAVTSSIPIHDRAVSPEHARIVARADDTAAVEDLGSSDGTFLDGQPVAGLTAWAPGQSLHLGDAALRFEIIPHASETYAPTLSPSQLVAGTEPAVTTSNSEPIGQFALSGQQAGEDGMVARQLPLTDRRTQRLEVGKEIARGAMGAVLAARESATRRTVAMKVMLQIGNLQNAMRFIEEAQVTAQLEHPNIVPVYELSVDERDQPFYTMKLVQGITLKKILELIKNGRAETIAKYPLGTLLTIFQKICDALAFAHSKGVIHRDLKPENIMLGRYGEVLVMDWGLAKIVGTTAGGREAETFQPEVTVAGLRVDSPEGHATMAGSIMGTPYYMSPEQARGEVDALDPRSDVFTLGVILYELLTLERPFTGRNAAEIIGKIMTGDCVPPAQQVAGRAKDAADEPREKHASHLPNGRVPESLDAIVRKAMQPEPAARYPSVKALQDDLLAYQNGFTTSAEQKSAWKQLRMLVKRHKGVSTAILGSLLLIVLLSTGFSLKVLSERNRAEKALTDLRAAAPTLVAQARILVEQQQLDSAIEKLDFALTIDPRNPEYLRARANYLQATLRLAEAATAYRTLLVIAPDGIAKENLALCERLARRTEDPAALRELYDAMRIQKRDTEAITLAQKLGLGSEAALAAINAAVGDWMALPGWKTGGDRIYRTTGGSYALRLNDCPIQSLERLRPLVGQPVTTLLMGNTLVRDLAPLAGLDLTVIVADTSPVNDLTPLTGMKLQLLRLTNTEVESLAPLRGMPLNELSVASCRRVADLDPVRGAPLRLLNISHTSISDLSALQGMALRELNITGCPISSLAPLAGLSVEVLKAGLDKRVHSLEPLRRLPLRYLDLGQGKYADLRPLLDCPTLETLIVPDAPGLTELRQLPKLKEIGHRSTSLRPAAEFWADYDAKRAANQ